MKRRFPIVKYIRTKLRNAIRITTAAAILHNMALDCNDEVPDDDHPDCRRFKDIDDEVHELNRPIVLNNLNPAERKTRAYQIRYNWRLGMDPIPTRKERGMMANHRVQAEIRRYARRWTLYPEPVLCTLYVELCTLYFVPCSLYVVLCTLFSVQCTLHYVTHTCRHQS